VPAPAALDPAITECQTTAAEIPWWRSEQPFAAYESAHARLQPRETAYFRLGDALLEIAVDEPSILDPVRTHYGECELSSLDKISMPLMRCAVTPGYPSPLIAIHFLEGAPPDLATMALGLSHPPLGAPPYSINDARRTGWSLIGGSDTSVVAACPTGLLVDPRSVAEDFVADYLVAAMLCAQPNLMVLHAAAVQIGSNGVILTGASHAGKTTTSMHLALRGHRLLGDEMSVVRLGSRELVPLRRSLSLRAGPRSPELARALRRVRPRDRNSVDGKIGPLRIDEMFPGSGDGPVDLKAAFFLDGFAQCPGIEPFALSLNDEATFDYMSANDVASISWGLEPQRRVLRLLALKQLMARVRCWKLCLGPPDETAKLIESTMEER